MYKKIGLVEIKIRLRQNLKLKIYLVKRRARILKVIINKCRLEIKKNGSAMQGFLRRRVKKSKDSIRGYSRY
jgi:hypothetical protein